MMAKQPMRFYDVRTREGFTTTEWTVDTDKRGRKRAKTKVRGYAVYVYF